MRLVCILQVSTGLGETREGAEMCKRSSLLAADKQTHATD